MTMQERRDGQDRRREHGYHDQENRYAPPEWHRRSLVDELVLVVALSPSLWPQDVREPDGDEGGESEGGHDEISQDRRRVPRRRRRADVRANSGHDERQSEHAGCHDGGDPDRGPRRESRYRTSSNDLPDALLARAASFGVPILRDRAAVVEAISAGRRS